MSRPTPRSIVRFLVPVAACLAVLALVQRVQDNDSAAATPGLGVTFSGKAFAEGPAGEPPVMRVRGLRQGQATSGTVTVRNPGPGSRYFWLSSGRISEQLGSAGGRLTGAVALTVMDVTDIASPAVIYRGPLDRLGARPLGFLAPGGKRSFSFVAELPLGGRSPGAPEVDPFRGATASVGWTWHSIAGRPATAAPVRPRRDDRAPRVTFSVPRRQGLLQRRALILTTRCDEGCSLRAGARMRAAGRSWKLAARRSGPGLQTRRRITVRFQEPRPRRCAGRCWAAG